MRFRIGITLWCHMTVRVLGTILVPKTHTVPETRTEFYSIHIPMRELLWRRLKPMGGKASPNCLYNPPRDFYISSFECEHNTIFCYSLKILHIIKYISLTLLVIHPLTHTLSHSALHILTISAGKLYDMEFMLFLIWYLNLPFDYYITIIKLAGYGDRHIC